MDLKNARSRIATARTALQKADSILELCREMDVYAGETSMLHYLQKEIHQQVGRLDFLYNTLQTIEDTVQEEE